MKRVLLHPAASILLFALSLAACSQTNIPAPVEKEAVGVIEETPTAVPTFTPTVPPPTVTSTTGPPTATPTLVVVTPSPTVSPPATDTPIPAGAAGASQIIHVIEQYDTLFGLALEYGVTLENLLAANGLSENDFLQLGQEIIIPSLEDDPPTPGEAAGATTGSEQAADTGSTLTEDASATETVTESGPETTQAANEAAPPTNVPAPAVSAPPPPAVSHGANINPLTGLPVDDPAKLRRRPLLVRIGNDTGARQSQVSLNQADIVYEEITEWWVTRFTAIFLANTPTTISPIRSARLINVQLAPQYQGALAHSGGSDGVRWEISQAPIANLDEFYNMAPYFYRPNEGWQTRLAIDAEAARSYMTDNGLEAAVEQNGFLFSDAPEGGEPGEDIFIPYPSVTSFTEWHYDAALGKYLRWINGSPLIDASDGSQVAASNVIVYFAQHQPTDIVEDSNGATSIRIIINGVGPAWMFRDGKLSRGAWQSDGTSTPFFTTEAGTPYALKPGNTWVEVVPTFYTIGLNSPDEASSR